MDHAQQLCPYLERRDSRCSGVMTMTNLREALSRCAGGHDYCPTYHRIKLSDFSRDCSRRLVTQPA